MRLTRVAAIQTKRRTIPCKVATPAEALDHVRANLDELVALAERAGETGCRIIAFPEDTLGTLEWEAGHWGEVHALLRPAEEEMLARFGEVAARHRVCLICCNDCVETDRVFNAAILIGPDGQEIGRYHKVNLPIHEQSRTRGTHFPVFEAPGVGTVGMCICYDMVFPETTRALALAGADIVFHLTMGGASMAGADASRAAFRTRAADNFLYLVVAFRGGGSLIISPKGEVLADGGNEPDAIVAADVDLGAGRDAGDALGGVTSDFRARLFRERVPSAYGILMDEHPPILDKLRHVPVPSGEEASALCAEGMTTGADAFYEAERWLAEGKHEEAALRFEQLAEHFGSLWMGRASRERLEKIRHKGSQTQC
jgi:predicted amidohydrolase